VNAGADFDGVTWCIHPGPTHKLQPAAPSPLHHNPLYLPYILHPQSRPTSLRTHYLPTPCSLPATLTHGERTLPPATTHATYRLFCGSRILPGHSDRVAAALRAQASALGVLLQEYSPVLQVQAGQLQTGDGAWHSFDVALWCTQAAAAGWLRDTGLPVGGWWEGALLAGVHLSRRRLIAC
jgi:hypothetical protein